jgi:hypothetical protein
MSKFALLTTTIGICMVATQALAGSDLENFKNAVREGKYLCMTPDPSLGCQSYSHYSVDGSTVTAQNEVIVAASPPVIALFSTRQSLPDSENCWMTANDQITEGPHFFRGGELLPEIERTMFENNFNNRMVNRRANTSKVCAHFSDGPKGRMINYTYDNNSSDDPPVYFSYHMRQNLPPLALGVKSLLLSQ